MEQQEEEAKKSPIVLLQFAATPGGELPPQSMRQPQGTSAPPPTAPAAAGRWRVRRPSADYPQQQAGNRKPQLVRGSRYRMAARPAEAPTIGEFLRPCMDQWLGRNVACQVCPAATFASRASLFLPPASVEGVVVPLEVFPQADQVVLIYPPLHGELLAHLRSNGGLPETAAAGYLRQVAILVASAHEHGIVLRCLKLKRLVFTNSSLTTIRLSSLQDAVVVESLAEGGDLLDSKCGCPAYVAPEMMHPGPHSGRAADMWNVGIILYALLAGRYPFFDINRVALLLKIYSGSYDVPESLSPEARSLVRSLLAHDPASRPTAKDVLRHPWLANTDPHPSAVSSRHLSIAREI